MTENLSTAYDAIALLESLGLPVSQEQLLQVKQLEQQYIDDVIVPHIQKECEPLLEDLIGKWSGYSSCLKRRFKSSYRLNIRRI